MRKRVNRREAGGRIKGRKAGRVPGAAFVVKFGIGSHQRPAEAPALPSAQSSLVVLLGAYALFAVAMPSGRGPTVCVFRRVTGHRCPLCGLTRATHALARGHARESFRHHRLALPFWAAAIAWCVAPHWRVVAGGRNLDVGWGGNAGMRLGSTSLWAHSSGAVSRRAASAETASNAGQLVFGEREVSAGGQGRSGAARP
jgi:hypothetical protein